jgi:hypothetical protein
LKAGTTTCRWDEVVLANKVDEQRINNIIHKAVLNNRQSEGEDEYELLGEVVFAKHGLVSYMVSEYAHSNGAAHGWRSFITLNFDTASGLAVNFHDFLQHNMVGEADSLIIKKLNERLGANVSGDEVWHSQLNQLSFQINDNGIDVLFRGDSYANSIIEVVLPFSEFAPFLNKNGLLKWACK